MQGIPENDRPYERLLPMDEVIEILGLSARPNPTGSLRWLMRSRRLAYVRLARGIYGFRRADLEAYIEANRVPAVPPDRAPRHTNQRRES